MPIPLRGFFGPSHRRRMSNAECRSEFDPPARGARLGRKRRFATSTGRATGVAAPGMQTPEFRELEPPASFASGTEAGSVALGRVHFRDDRRVIGIDADAWKRHVYCIGATGTGKSTLLLNLIQQTIQA